MAKLNRYGDIVGNKPKRKWLFNPFRGVSSKDIAELLAGGGCLLVAASVFLFKASVVIFLCYMIYLGVMHLTGNN